jgi:two-component system, chemotaxis family, response regulator Rcp1
MIPGTAPVEILLVEDNPGDVRLVQEALRDCDAPLHLTVARDGEEALDYLFQSRGHETVPRPHIILLDLNLPKKSGHEVLHGVKSNAALCSIPVVILSSAASREEVNRCYQLSANCYIRKSMDLEGTLQSVRDICFFWLRRVVLPTGV